MAGQNIVPPLVNFAALAAGLFYVLRKPTREFVEARHQTLRASVQESEAKLRDAQARYDEFSSKLKAIDVELTSLRNYTLDGAKASAGALVIEAQKLSASLRDDAARTARAFAADFQAEMSSEFARKALDRAEAVLRQRLTGDEQVRIRREVSKQLEQVR